MLGFLAVVSLILPFFAYPQHQPSSNNDEIPLNVFLKDLPSNITRTEDWRSKVDGRILRAHHNLTWNSLREVDGLKNEEVVIVIASTTNKNMNYLRERVIPSARTWMRMFANAFVMLEDNIQIRFDLRHCEAKESEKFTSFVCPHEPTYILTRVCKEVYYRAEGICCKIDETINYLVHAEPVLYSKMKYLLQSDDDTFWRADQSLRWLAAIEKSGVNHLPLVGNDYPRPSATKRWGGGIWHIKNCQEINSVGWYQPMMLNKAAIERIRVATDSFGITATCTNFDLSQDSGLGVFFWILQLYHVRIPTVEGNANHKGIEVLKSNQTVVHQVKKWENDDCGGKTWSPEHRYDQHMIVGCGKIDSVPPGHNKTLHLDMYDAWNWFQTYGTDITTGILGAEDWEMAIIPPPPINAYEGGGITTTSTSTTTTTTTTDQSPHLIPAITPLLGYEKSQHAKTHDVTKVWTPFTLKDCEPEGWIDKKR